MRALLFVAHSSLPGSAGGSFRVLLYRLVGVIAVLAVPQIPLVMRILKRHFSERWALRESVSQVLTFDCLGALALAVAVAFPLLFVPHLGLVRTGLFFGLLNTAVAVWALVIFRGELRRFGAFVVACGAVLATLLAAMFGADHLTSRAEDRIYGEQNHRARKQRLPARDGDRVAQATRVCASSSTATCSSTAGMSTAAPRASCILRWPRTANPGVCGC